MRILTIFISIAIFITFACRGTEHSFHGLWKVKRVEVMQGSELKKLIDTGSQYWDMRTKSGIDIFDNGQLQNRLSIKTAANSIQSFDPATGNLKDEFVIEKFDKQNLELSSRQTINENDYQVIYYLDKVPDTAVASVLDAF
jgi:hypothetical protein